MLSTKKLWLIFSPALLLVGLIFFIQVVRYEPLFPKPDKTEANTTPDEIPLFADDIIIGNKKAPITLTMFSDFGCPACKQANAPLETLLNTHPDKVKIVWKGLPVARFPYSTESAEKYGFCAYGQGKFKEFKTMAFANGDNLSDATLGTIADTIGLDKDDLGDCLASEAPNQYLQKVKQLAILLNVQAVPAFFVKGKQVKTPQSVEDWQNLLNL